MQRRDCARVDFAAVFEMRYRVTRITNDVMSTGAADQRVDVDRGDDDDVRCAE